LSCVTSKEGPLKTVKRGQGLLVQCEGRLEKPRRKGLLAGTGKEEQQTEEEGEIAPPTKREVTERGFLEKRGKNRGALYRGKKHS